MTPPTAASNAPPALAEVLAALGTRGPLGAGAAARATLFGHLFQDFRAAVQQQRRHVVAVDPTPAVHAACERLAGLTRIDAVQRAHLLAHAARVMRSVLVDLARAAGGAGEPPLRLCALPQADVLQLDALLAELHVSDPVLAAAAEMHCFGGLHALEVAMAQGMSVRKAERVRQQALGWVLPRLTP